MMRQTVTFTEFRPAEFRSAISRFIAVYTAAMNPPERMLAGREAILERHAGNPGFRALAAVLPRGALLPRGAEPPQTPQAPLALDGVLAGFTYGFHGVPGQWWHDTVAGLIALQAEYAAWHDVLPDNLRDTATRAALQAIVDLDLDDLISIEPPRRFGRD